MVDHSLKCRIQGLLPWLRNTFCVCVCIFKNLTLFVLLIINIMLLLAIFQHILDAVPIRINQYIWTSESREQIR